MGTQGICSHLEPIVARELRDGNAISSVTTREYANCDLLIQLQRPFARYYEPDLPSNVTGHTNSDPHYPVGKGYFCSIDRHDVFAPQELRR